MMERVVLVVGAYSSGSALPSALSRRGARVIHVRPSGVPDRMERTYSGDGVAEEIRAEALTHDELLSLVDRLAPLAIVPGSEVGVPLAFSLSMRAPQGRCRIFYDKSEQITALERAGLRVPASFVALTAEHAVSWARAIGFQTVVVKPLSSTASDNVALCAEPFEESIGRAARRIFERPNALGRTENAVLVQEVLRGTEYVVDLVFDGQDTGVAALFSYEKRAANGAPFVYHALVGMDARDQAARDRAAYAESVVRALLPSREIVTAAHVEVIDDCVVDIGFRPHGGNGARVGAAMTGYGQVEMLADAVLERTKFSANLDSGCAPLRFARKEFLIARGCGIGRFGPFLERVSALPTFQWFAPRKREGENVEPTVDLLTVPGSALFLDTEPSRVLADCVAMRSIELAHPVVAERE